MRSVIFGLGLVAAVAVGCGDEADDCDCAAAGCFADVCTKTVFVTAEPVAAKFGGVEAADQLCAQQAAAAQLPGVYLAWLSDGSHSPFQRFSKSTVPYVRTDGTQVATDFEALRSEHDAALARADKQRGDLDLKIAALARKFEESLDRLTDNRELISGIKAFLRMVRDPAPLPVE